MRRGLLLATAVLATAGLGAWLLPSSGSGSTYRVAAVFDTAKGMVPGQLVKVAGARVGEVESVELTSGLQARMVLTVDERFAPFRADATCRILPEGLITENFVECDPGTPGRRPLQAGHVDVPTVPLERTTAPLSLQDLLNTFDLSTSQRLRILFNDLGLGAAGRGADVNDILRRANPALTSARRVLASLSRQRHAVADAVTQTDGVIDALAERDHDVRAFVDRAGLTLRTSGARAASLESAVQRLPATLDAARGGMRSLGRATAAALPLLGDLREAAPQLTGLTQALPRFSRPGRPAVRALADAARRGRSALPELRPVVGQLGRMSGDAAPFTSNLATSLSDIRRRGGFEEILKFFYALSTSTSTYDDVSHYFSLFVGVQPQCLVPQHIIPVPGCSHRFNAPGNGQIPVNDPSIRQAQARALVRGLDRHPGLARKRPEVATLRKLFLSKRDQASDIASTKALLDFLLK